MWVEIWGALKHAKHHIFGREMGTPISDVFLGNLCNLTARLDTNQFFGVASCRDNPSISHNTAMIFPSKRISSNGSPSPKGFPKHQHDTMNFQRNLGSSWSKEPKSKNKHRPNSGKHGPEDSTKKHQTRRSNSERTEAAETRRLVAQLLADRVGDSSRDRPAADAALALTQSAPWAPTAAPKAAAKAVLPPAPREEREM